MVVDLKPRGNKGICICICIRIRICACMYACIYLCIYACMSVDDRQFDRQIVGQIDRGRHENERLRCRLCGPAAAPSRRPWIWSCRPALVCRIWGLGFRVEEVLDFGFRLRV